MSQEFISVSLDFLQPPNQKAVEQITGAEFGTNTLIGIGLVDPQERSWARVLEFPQEGEDNRLVATAETGLLAEYWQISAAAFLQGGLEVTNLTAGDIVLGLKQNQGALLLLSPYSKNSVIKLINPGGSGNYWSALKNNQLMGILRGGEEKHTSIENLGVTEILAARVYGLYRKFMEDRGTLFDGLLTTVIKDRTNENVRQPIIEKMQRYGIGSSLSLFDAIFQVSGLDVDGMMDSLTGGIDRLGRELVQKEGGNLPVYQALIATVGGLTEIFNQAQTVVGELKSPEWVYRF
jgi:hypothetical protein